MALNPKASRYKVRKGDCLWNIAKTQYGDPSRWRDISKSNGLRKPGLILIGQTLKLPTVDTAPQVASKRGLMPPSDANSRARPVANPAFTYELGKFPAISFDSGAFSITLQLKGNLVLQKRGFTEDFEVSLSGVKFKYQPENDTAFRGLMSDATIKIGPPNVLEMTCNLSSAAGIGGEGLKSSIGISDPVTGEITFECEGREMKGARGPFSFKGVVGFEAKLKRKGEVTPSSGSQAVVVRNMCLVGAILTATVVADIVSLGGAIPENAISYGAATMLLTGT